MLHSLYTAWGPSHIQFFSLYFNCEIQGHVNINGPALPVEFFILIHLLCYFLEPAWIDPTRTLDFFHAFPVKIWEDTANLKSVWNDVLPLVTCYLGALSYFILKPIKWIRKKKPELRWIKNNAKSKSLGVTSLLSNLVGFPAFPAHLLGLFFFFLHR